ncbi:tyrosine-type recombinase/integrase [Anatilimnocola floriformis]|uniref:tyrosine-type recombinase/integrase n=1 Tax=Anatilimnocola floriformis TaxID=2948575 RepID=UPI0020C42420|nr:tyrosine-type recombinase/integrase [Anatilimnocola floriformis]
MSNKGDRLLVGERVKIYKRGRKQTWTACFYWGGKHHRVSLRTRNEKAARRQAVALEAELIEGEYRPSRQVTKEALPLVTVAQAKDEYLAFKRSGKFRKKSQDKYTSAIREFQMFCDGIGTKHIADVTLRIFDRYRAKRSAERAEKTVHTELVILKGFFKWCAERKLVTEDPLANETFVKPRSKPKGSPDLMQVNQVLSQFTGPRLVALSILAFTGMRAGECQRLRYDLGDVDLDGNWIHIVSREGEDKTKSGDSWKVPIHPRLKKLLEIIPKSKRTWFLNAPPSRQYPNGDHRHNMKHLTEAFEEALGKLDIPAGRKNNGFVLHSLRAFFKTHCVNEGIPREVVDAWQNHKDGRRETASDRYYRLSDEESQKQMKKVPFGDG